MQTGNVHNKIQTLLPDHIHVIGIESIFIFYLTIELGSFTAFSSHNVTFILFDRFT